MDASVPSYLAICHVRNIKKIKQKTIFNELQWNEVSNASIQRNGKGYKNNLNNKQ